MATPKDARSVTKINGQEFKYVARPLATEKDLGATSGDLAEMISGGPQGLVDAQREAHRLAKVLGEEVEASWCLETQWLKELKGRNVRAYRSALRWRPRFLAAYQLSASIVVASRAARVTYAKAYWHQERDEEFAEQIKKTEVLAAEVLHAACWKSTIEGDLEPVYWQGLRIGSIRKMDSRLRIEMLRAHMPARFKTPANANVTINQDNQSVFVIDEKTRDAIVAKRRAALRRIQESKGKDSGHPQQNESAGVLTRST